MMAILQNGGLTQMCSCECVSPSLASVMATMSSMTLLPFAAIVVAGEVEGLNGRWGSSMKVSP